MSKWNNMDDHPTDKIVVLDIPSFGEMKAIYTYGYAVDLDEHEVFAWVSMDEDNEPECWTDGVCLDQNENDEQSLQPKRWRHLQPSDKIDQRLLNSTNAT